MTLTNNEKEQIMAIEKYTEEVLAGDKTGHSMDHIYRVVNNAKKIQKKEGGNLFLILAGAYLHDVTDDKLVEDSEVAKNELVHFLESLQLSSQTIQEILRIIERVSFSHQLASNEKISLTLEEKIVQDADRLDAIGAIGIGRTFYYGGKKGHAMYDSNIPPRENLTKEEYRVNQTVINHFYEKLFKLKEMMQTETGKELAEKRDKMMRVFVESFLEEWGENK